MFEVGDKVRAFGVDGVVVSITYSGDYPVEVEFTLLDMDKRTDSFDKNGKYMKWHKEPTLVLVEKAKKKVKKYLFAFKDVYGVWSISQRLYSESEAASISTLYQRLDQTMVEVEE